MISPPIQYATTSDGVRIGFMSIGSGPPVVFASNIFGELNAYRVGWPSCREVTDRLVALGWRVIRYDVRGMGSSDREVEDLSLEGRIRDLDAVVSHLGLERFALAGVDIGAATAISYAVRNQERLSALVLVTPWASGARYLQIPRLRAAYSAEPLADDDSKLFASIMGSVATAFEDPDLVRLHAESFLQTATVAGLAAYNAANARIDVTDANPRRLTFGVSLECWPTWLTNDRFAYGATGGETTMYEQTVGSSQRGVWFQAGGPGGVTAFGDGRVAVFVAPATPSRAQTSGSGPRTVRPPECR